MAFREVVMHEVTDVLRLWSSGLPLRRLAELLSLDRKTVRRYVEAAQQAGVQPGNAPTHERLAGVAALVQAMPGRPHGESWAAVARLLAIGCRTARPRTSGAVKSSRSRLPLANHPDTDLR